MKPEDRAALDQAWVFYAKPWMGEDIGAAFQQGFEDGIAHARKEQEQASKADRAPAQEGGKYNFASHEQWWFLHGSALRPHEGEDAEAHAKRVSAESWQACEAQRERVCRWKRVEIGAVSHVSTCGGQFLSAGVPDKCPNCGGKVEEGEG